MVDTAIPKNVCIIRLSAIGDCCHVLPVLRTLQSAWPNARFTWIVGKVEASLVGDIPGIDFVVLDKQLGLRAYLAVRRALHGRKFDLLLHMHASMRANLVSLMVSAPYRLGFDKPRARDRQWLFTNQQINSQPRQHVLDGLFGFAEHFGVTERHMRWDIPLEDSDRAAATQEIEPDRPMLVISPCSSQRLRNFRNWSAQHYAAVAAHATKKYGMQVVLTGGSTPLEREYGEHIAALQGEKTINLIGKTTLKQLLAVLERATVVLCPDSGPAHMATAVGTPVIGLYATSNPGRTGPYLSQRWVVNKYPEAVGLELGKSAEELRWGARVRNPRAMNLIEVADVTAKLDQLMAAAIP
ncbi:MAG: glycosyltransferase family 9 protein [Gammaproteobacteria bacterium]|nr:glycosyltransferase family 9 protein [Gammaproteobacteria bacterium]